MSALPVNYTDWLRTGDNLDRVIAYFDDVVGVSANAASQDGMYYDENTKMLSFDEFAFNDKGIKVFNADRTDLLKTPRSVSVATPPPWHGEV